MNHKNKPPVTGDMAVMDAEVLEDARQGSGPAPGGSLVVTPKAEVSTDVLNLSEFEAEAGKGNEGVGAEDLQIQYLQLVEGMSDVLKPNTGSYDADVKQGDIRNSVTGKFVRGSEGLFGIPVHYSKEIVIWNGKKPMGRMPIGCPEDLAVKAANVRHPKTKKLLNADGHLHTETHSQAFLLVDPKSGITKRAVISMAGTRIKKARLLNTRIDDVIEKGSGGKEFNPARYMQLYRICTLGETNDEGNFFNWEFKYNGLVTSRAIFQKAKAYHDELHAKGVPLAAPDEGDHADAGGDGKDGDVPF